MAKTAGLFTPPRLRTLEDTAEERRATWFELFFDLVFVVTVAEIGLVLSDDATLGGLLSYLALFVPVWWAWMGFTYYANRFDTDDLTYRLLTLAGMFAVAALATQVHGALHGGESEFALAYVAVRLPLLVLYARAIRHVSQGRAIAAFYFSAFGAAVCLWLASLALDGPERFWLWAAALTLEVSAPLVGWRLLPGVPVDPRHIPERFGLLTLIVLGESILAVVVGVADVSWTAETGLTAAGGFVAAAAVWWIYFEFVTAPLGRGVLGGLVFTYAHYPVVVGIATMGVGVKLAILAAGGEVKYDDTAWVMAVGVALAMAGLAAIQLVIPPRILDIDELLRLGAAAGALGVAALDAVLAPVVIVWLLAGLLVAQVVIELGGHEDHTPVQAPKL